MNKYFILFLFAISICGWKCKDSCDFPDPCAECKGDYICVDNRCECPEGMVDIGRGCIDAEKGVLNASTTGTPIECLGDVTLSFTPSMKDENSWAQMTLYYHNPINNAYTLGEPNFSAKYKVGPFADTIRDDFFFLTHRACDSVSSLGRNAKFEGIYYKDINVFKATFIRWKSHPLVPIDTFELLFK